MRIIADSTNEHGIRLTTFVITIPTCLLAELRTHRLFRWSDTDFSVNANSDRAIPISKKIDMVEKNYYNPIVSLANKGMSGIEENIPKDVIEYAENSWITFKNETIKNCRMLEQLGLHKQYVNRLLMPFSLSDVIVTGDNFAFLNFFKLRCTLDTEPNFRKIANQMFTLYKNNVPKFIDTNEYHIAFDDEIDKDIKGLDRLLVSASMCARISYNIDKKESLEKHIERAIKCYKSGHYSIFEHQARPMLKSERNSEEYRSNVKDWILLRKDLELDNIKF